MRLSDIFHTMLCFTLVAIFVILPVGLSYYYWNNHTDISHISAFLSCLSIFVFLINIFKEYPGPLAALLGIFLIQSLQCMFLWLPVIIFHYAP